MKKIILIASIGMVLFAQSSLEIAKKSYEATTGYESSIAKTTMVIRNATGEENIRKLEIKKLENIKGDKSIINFLYPNDIKETKLLSYEEIGGNDKQWLYLPALKRVKKIASDNKSGSFMASEFSYEDIASQNYLNYSYEKEVKKEKIDSKEYFIIKRIPIDVNSGYSYQIIYIEPASYLPLFGEFYDKQNRLLKKIYFENYRKINGVNRVSKITIKNLQNNKSSVLIWDEDKIKQNLSEDDFSQRVLR
jgi:hypothetical protein